MAKGRKKNGSDKVGTQIGAAAVDWLTVVFQAEGDALIGLEMEKLLGGVPLKISRFTTTNEGSEAREDDGFQRATQASKTYGANETGQNAVCGIYYKTDFLPKRLILQFRGEFFTLARSPWERIYKICGALSETLRGCPYYVSRIDVQRMFIGAPSDLFPDPASPRVFFAFLKSNDEVRRHMGNYEIQKSDYKVTLYDKIRELERRKEDAPYRLTVERGLAEAGISPSTRVSRFEVRSIGSDTRICREATALLHSQRLQEEGHLVRLLSLFLETHVVKEPGPRANPHGKTREYMSKRWPASKKWLALFAVTEKPKKGSTKTYATGNVTLRFRPGRSESLLLRFLEASFHEGLKLDEIRRMVDAGARAGMERYVDRLVDLEVGEAFLTGETVPPAGAVEATGEVVPAEPARGQGSCITLDHDPTVDATESKECGGSRSTKIAPKKLKPADKTPRKRNKKLNPLDDKDFEIIRLQSLGDLLDKTARVAFREALMKRKLQEHGLVKLRRKKKGRRKVKSKRNS